MSCPDDNVLNAWLEGLLGPGDRARVEAHLASCETCRAITGQPEVGAITEQAHQVGARPLTRVGRFELVRKIGEGGMGLTFVARDEELARDVCLKVLKPLEEGDAAAERQRLLSEARAQAQLSHPAIIPVYEVVSADDVVALVMEYVRDGTSLRAWLRGAHSLAERVEVLLQAAEGLAAAHAAGIVHRDFKPDNVMLDRGRARLIDFGLARHVVDLGAGAATPTGAPLTVTVAAGTPGYMSPEQFAGEPGGPRADQYAFCVTLYEALTGARPFRRKTLGEQLKAQLAGDVPGHEQVPPPLHAVLKRGLAADADARFPDMPALIAAVRVAMAPARKVESARWVVVGVTVAAAIGVALLAPRDAASPTSSPGVLSLAVDAAVEGPEQPPPAPSELAQPALVQPEPAQPQQDDVPDPGEPDVPNAPSPKGAKKVSVKVSSSLPAQVLERGKVVGRSPGKLLLAPGRHALVFVSTAQHARRAVTVSAPGEVSVTFEQANLELRVSPWAYVSIDGKPLGESPVPAQTLFEGPHVVRFERPDLGYRKDVQVTLSAGQRLVVRHVVP